MEQIKLIISYSIQSEEYMDYTFEIISEFLSQIKENEPDTIMYQTFQSTDDPTRFFHVMTFTDESAQIIHRNSSYCEEFISKLYPICIKEPTIVNLDELKYHI